MKVKPDTVAFIVANSILKAHVEAIFEEQRRSGDVIVVEMDVSNLREEGQRLVNLGVGAMVARGGTYEDLKKEITQVPVIKIEMAASDILFSLARAKASYKEIYLILYEDILFDFETWKDLLSISLTVQRYRSIDELKRILDAIEVSPDTVVVGGGACSVLSQQKQLNTIEVLPRRDTNILAYENARNIISQMRRERSQVNQLESILYSVGEGVIIIDRSGRILHFNRRSEELLSVDKQYAVGRPISGIIPDPALGQWLGARPFSPKHGVIEAGGRKLSLRVDLFRVYQNEEQFILTLSEVARIQKLEQDIRRRLSHKGLVAQYTFDDILTQNDRFRGSIEKAKKLTDVQGSVLIFGESGTGKELFAQSIHNGSPRKNGPFVAVNCAALSESILESELFGYVAGAFTGAKKEGKAGLFELAHEGTIFLDEINSMPLSVQSKVLRVLEQKEVMRLGADYVIPLDVRIIAAANEPLLEAVKAGTFRQDLYFRLNTFELKIQPLRERREDILFLFRYYLSQYCKAAGSGKAAALDGSRGHDSNDHRGAGAPGNDGRGSGDGGGSLALEADFVEQLVKHDWLGNVRELKNTALRYVTFNGDNSNGDILNVSVKAKAAGNVYGGQGKTFGGGGAAGGGAAPDAVVGDDLRIDLKALSRTVEALVIQNLLDRGVPKQDIARLLGISRQALFQKINKMKDREVDE